jgi:catechol 2,3-dioxygenase-like lactoylglutathione lyase family enzyme
MWLGVLHTGFTVSDIDRSVAWYTDVLGLELVSRQRNDNLYTRTIVGIDDAVLEVAFFRLPGESSGPSTHMLELMQYVSPEGGKVSGLTEDVGVGHLALMVDDIQEAYSRMAQAGVKFRNPPVEISEGANKGAWACYLLDPDGITIELVQPAHSGSTKTRRMR